MILVLLVQMKDCILNGDQVQINNQINVVLDKLLWALDQDLNSLLLLTLEIVEVLLQDLLLDRKDNGESVVLLDHQVRY